MANTSSVSFQSSDVDRSSFARKMEEEDDAHQSPYANPEELPDYSVVAGGSELDEDILGDEDDEAEEEEEDDGQIGVRALAYDPNQLSSSNGLPVNGHDFLKMVQEERDRLPGIVTVRPPASLTKKSTQGSSTVAMEVLQSSEQSAPHEDENQLQSNQENNLATQQSSVHPMETSQRCDTFIDSSDEDEEEQASIYSSITSREYRDMIRLKSLGCTPLNISQGPVKRPAPATPATSKQTSDLLHRDRILANFIKLRQKIEAVRRESREAGDEGGTGGEPQHELGLEANDYADDQDRVQGKVGRKNAEKNWNRSERRAAGLIKIINLGHAPQESMLVHKSQMVIHMTLDKIVEQCERAPIYSTLHADWIYSLIALLREPIEPDICSTLRRLARVCMARRDSYERRSGADPSKQPHLVREGEAACSSRALVEAINKEEYYACLLIICIVRFHFGQADLK